MDGESTDFEHQPVMVREIEAIFGPGGPGVVVDATVGGGGHAAALLAASPVLDVVGLDQDGAALAAAARRLGPFGDRVTLRRARFDALADTIEHLGRHDVLGVLFDLGVSSHQLDAPERGFSYRFAGPLDMRMDTGARRTAADVVNGYQRDELIDVLRRYGDERYAARIVDAIIAARPVSTTAELADVVRQAIPAPARRRGGHPAKRTFQALRIEVNDELDVLPRALEQAIEVLQPGGRIAVLAYHSGEDRLVKEVLREASTGGCTCPPGLPCVCGAQPTIRLLKRGAQRPRPDEVEANPRAESARLRSAEKLAAAA